MSERVSEGASERVSDSVSQRREVPSRQVLTRTHVQPRRRRDFIISNESRVGGLDQKCRVSSSEDQADDTKPESPVDGPKVQRPKALDERVARHRLVQKHLLEKGNGGRVPQEEEDLCRKRWGRDAQARETGDDHEQPL